jgi:hypothetical protein
VSDDISQLPPNMKRQLARFEISDSQDSSNNEGRRNIRRKLSIIEEPIQQTKNL